MHSRIRTSAPYQNNSYSSRSALTDHHPEKPLSEGDLAPAFTFSSARWLEARSGIDISLNRFYHRKPLILVFYSTQWNGHGTGLLKRLDALKKKNGTANVLIIGSEAARQTLRALTGHQFTFSFYLDTEHILAERFGVYSEDRPTWNLYSGINSNVPLLSTYIISPSGQISFSHIDDFSTGFPEGDFLSAINEESERSLS